MILGLLCVGLGLYASYGIGGLVGLRNTNMNSIMPFLLLGIGVRGLTFSYLCI